MRYWAVIIFGAVMVFCGLVIGQDLSANYGFDEIEIIKIEQGISNLRLADLDGDGRQDIALVNNRKAKIELLIQRDWPVERDSLVGDEQTDINELFPLTRFERQYVPVTQNMFSLVTGDLNSDGMVDLAFYGDPAGLYVILQQDSEDSVNKLSWQTRKRIDIKDGLKTRGALVCADLNNNGRDDLALAGQDKVYIVLQNEDGTLAEPKVYPSQSTIREIFVEDVDGNGNNDLVILTTDSENPVHIRFGQKNGTLGPQFKYFIDNPFMVRFANINGKSGKEILSIDRRTGRLSGYELSAEKVGEKWPVVFYPLESGRESRKRDIAAADLTGNGLTDIVISDPDSAEVILYRQKKSIGLTDPERFPAYSEITKIEPVDMSFDGAFDLVMLSVKEKSIGLSRYENERLSFPRPLEIEYEPMAMAVADIDNNGLADCVYVGKDPNDAYFLMGCMDLVAPEAGSVELCKLESLRVRPDGMMIFDADQNGLKDVLIFVEYEDPIFVRQSEIGKFEVVDPAGSKGSLINKADKRTTAVGDLVGLDAGRLLIAQDNFVRSLGFSAQEGWTVLDQYNGRGRDDQIWAAGAFEMQEETKLFMLEGQKGQLQVFKADEESMYRFETSVDVGRWQQADNLKMIQGEFTGAGARSILLFDSNQFAIVTPPDEVGRLFAISPMFNYETKINGGLYGNMAIGDINNNGKVEIVMLDYNRNNIEILAYDDQGSITSAMRFRVFEEKSAKERGQGGRGAVEPREMLIGDVTGDGRDDLVTVIHDRVIIYPQDSPEEKTEQAITAVN